MLASYSTRFYVPVLITTFFSVALAVEAVAVVPVRPVPLPQPARHVVGLWLLDEAEGPTDEENWGVYDQTGQGNHGVRQPVNSLSTRPAYSTNVPVAAPWNHSLDFGSSSSARVEIPDSDSLDLTGGFTVEAWVNLNSLLGDQYLVSKRPTDGTSSGYILEWAGSSQTFQFNVGTSKGFQGVFSRNFTPIPGLWYHVAGVHDPNANPSQMLLYIDGQLNNSRSANPVVQPNDDSLWLGGWATGGKSANAKLDQVRISARVVPSSELGFFRQEGPATIIFGDNFETYDDTGDLMSRSGGARNCWKNDAAGENGTFQLINDHAHSKSQSILMQHFKANSSGNRVAPYYNLPIAATRDEPIIATSGWVSFTGVENCRLFFQNQIWTGNQSHYGVASTNLAGGIQYWGDSMTWHFEDADGNGATTVVFSEPISYVQGLDVWHFYRFVMDYEKKEYVSFQFDDKVWDLSGYRFLVLPDFFPVTVIPVVDHNVRLLELSNPPHPYTAQFALDDATITAQSRPTADYNADGVVDAADYTLWQDTLGDAVPYGTGADGNNNGVIDDGDYQFWRENFRTSNRTATGNDSVNAVCDP